MVSIVGRYLEHTRLFAFYRGEERTYYIGSADLMPRNLDTRVELLTPVEDPELQAELDDTLERCFADDTFSWKLGADGRWTRRTGATRSVHRELMERALAQWSAVARPGPGTWLELKLGMDIYNASDRTPDFKNRGIAAEGEQQATDTSHFANPGTFYLQITTTCSWRLTAYE